jgi:predicted Fe-Mo cluster-binding NifX family protein
MVDVMTQRIVIPVDDNKGIASRVASHFGRAPYFAKIEVTGRGQIAKIEIERNTAENVAGTGNAYEDLLALRPAVIITREMSMGSIYSFQDAGIQVLKAKGSAINEVMSNFKMGMLYPLAADCLHR